MRLRPARHLSSVVRARRSLTNRATGVSWARLRALAADARDPRRRARAALMPAGKTIVFTDARATARISCTACGWQSGPFSARREVRGREGTRHDVLRAFAPVGKAADRRHPDTTCSSPRTCWGEGLNLQDADGVITTSLDRRVSRSVWARRPAGVAACGNSERDFLRPTPAGRSRSRATCREGPGQVAAGSAQVETAGEARGIPASTGVTLASWLDIQAPRPVGRAAFAGDRRQVLCVRIGGSSKATWWRRCFARPDPVAATRLLGHA